jgi:acyl-CoA dehydrogenase
MNFEFSQDQLLLRDQARGFLAEHCPPKAVRTVLDGEQDWDETLWNKVAEMGWQATVIPEAYGGLGLSYYELVIIAEELGRAVAPIPFGSSIYLAAEAIQHYGSEQQKSEWLPKLASGEAIATFALSEGPGRATVKSLAAQVSSEGLTGRKIPVPDAGIADVAVVVAANGDGAQLVLVPLKQSGVTVTPVRTLDFSRGHGCIEFNNAQAETLSGAKDGWLATQQLLDRAAVLYAWEQLGIADAALEQARQYALERYAFGRQIGSYQAIKHKLVAMYTKNTIARSNAYMGAWALQDGPEQLPLAAATARVAAIQASLFAAEENIQTHGGMGFTWEFDCQFFYRRAKLLSLAIGSEAHWQDRIVAALEHGAADPSQQAGA